MKRHEDIDRRSLALARAVVTKVDADPSRQAVDMARTRCARWLLSAPVRGIAEWMRLLDKPWEQVRAVLLSDDEEGRRLRQNNPFCGVLTPRERWAIYREFSDESRAA